MNPIPIGLISDMYGPTFLVLYGCVIVGVMVVCGVWIWRMDETRNLTPLPVPKNPNAYHIACLRGGENEVIRVLLFDLIQRGYLTAVEEKSGIFSKEQKLAKDPNHPHPRHLSAAGREVFDWFSSPKSARDIFQSPDLPGLLAQWLAESKERLDRDQLLTSEETQNAALLVKIGGALVILALGGYKLIAALSSGHSNVGFLIFMGFVGVLLLLKLCGPPRLSFRGSQHLKLLQQEYGQLQTCPSFARETGADPMLVLATALFGAAILQGTAYGYFQEMFRQSASTGGCGGGGCGGGGGGGGGCGGGGCGGCGGG